MYTPEEVKKATLEYFNDDEWVEEENDSMD